MGSSWQAVLAFDRKVLNLLFAGVDLTRLAALHRHCPPSDSFDVLIGQDVIGLWLGETRLSVIATTRPKR